MNALAPMEKEMRYEHVWVQTVWLDKKAPRKRSREKEGRIQQGLLRHKSREHALHVLLFSGGSVNTWGDLAEEDRVSFDPQVWRCQSGVLVGPVGSGLLLKQYLRAQACGRGRCSLHGSQQAKMGAAEIQISSLMACSQCPNFCHYQPPHKGSTMSQSTKPSIQGTWEDTPDGKDSTL